MRQAKSLFAPEMLKFIRLDLSGALPFEGIKFEQRQSMRYRSSFDVEQVIKAAQSELPVEQLKIFLLAIMAGLRPHGARVVAGLERVARELAGAR